MFLFLSKLLPLLVYPLGLSCLLLLLALVLVWWWPRRAAIAVALALLILLMSSNAWVAAQVVKSLEWRYTPLETIPTADAIVVLGGSTHSISWPRPWVEVSEAGDRVLYAVRLYQQEKAPLLVFSGGRIEWKGGGAAESADMAEIAIAMGVPRSAILQEPRSLNTYQNAVNVKPLLTRRRIGRVLLVTSAVHMPRSVAIFRKQGIEVIPAPTDYWVTEQSLAETRSSAQGRLINTLPDSEAIHYLTRALKEYVGFVVYRLRGWL